MVLEATLICVDNSEWTRNGDYVPTRFEAQQDAANLLCGVKTNQNIENCVGILTMAGERVDVRVTPTNDLGLILSGLHDVKIRGDSDFVRGIQTAQLALKHRMNKNQKQRIICFVASPVAADRKSLETLGKQLKKNNVALDVVSFGDVDVNSEKLQALHEVVNSNDSSHFIQCPAGTTQLLSEVILSSDLVRDPEAPARGADGGGAPAGGADVAGMNEFGVDPNIDPDLYMALRLSLEEANRGQGGGAAAASSAAETTTTAAPAAPTTAAAFAEAAPVTAIPATTLPDELGDIEMDDELREALLLSMQDYSGAAVTGTTAAAPSASEEAPLLSSTATESAGGSNAVGSSFSSPGFLQQMLGSLPGVDVTDPRLQSAVEETAEVERKRKAEEEQNKQEEDK